MPNKEMKVGIPKQEGQVSMSFSRGGVRDGAGRKGIGETRKVSITLASSTWDELEEHCRMQNASRSEIMRRIIESYLLDVNRGDR